jgi:predicted nicotinamide N-methyase
MTSIADRARFIVEHTEVMAPPLVPELRLHLAHEAVPLWQKTEEELGAMGLPPPFWAFAWAGGQALARHVLDRPELVRGKRVIDLAAGSGLVGIAARMAGAAHVLATDIDGFALVAMGLNADRNGVVLEMSGDNLLAAPPPDADVILVGDLFYEKTLAEQAWVWLMAARATGAAILIGDPGRSYLPRDRLTRLADYAVPVSRDLEDAEIKHTAVWQPV